MAKTTIPKILRHEMQENVSVSPDFTSVKADVAQLKAGGTGGGADLTELTAKVNTLIAPPSISSFAIDGNAVVEVGQNVNSNKFNWGINNAGSVKTAKIQDGNNANADLYSIPSANIASGTYTLTVGASKSEPFTQVYRLSVIDGNDKAYNANVYFNWQWAVYFGNLNSTTITEAQIKTLTKRLQSAPDTNNGNGTTYSIAAATGHKWFCIPENWSIASSMEGGFEFVLDTPITVQVTSNGVAKNYKAYRSYAPTNAAVAVIIKGSVS